MADGGVPQISTLNRAYDDAIKERDRLRAARGSAVQLLGPLPASAGIAIGLFGSLVKGIAPVFLIIAGSLLLLMVAIGIVYDNFKPYRVLRAEAEAALCPRDASDMTVSRPPFQLGHRLDINEADWLKHAIDVERKVYGEFTSEHTRIRWWRHNSTLQQLYEVERTGGYLVRIVFLAIIIDLVVGAIIAH